VKEFTVEVVLEPVVNDDWSTLRRVTDIMPGTILLEDAGEPTLIIPVEAETLKTAAVFVQGAMSVLKLTVTWGRAYVTEPCDWEDETSIGSHAGTVPDFAPSWLEDESTTKQQRELLPA